MEQDKAVLLAQKREAQQEKLSVRDELVRLEQDRLELDAARITLQHSLQDVQLSRVALDAELQSLREEKARLQERVAQVRKSLGANTAEQENIQGVCFFCCLLFSGSFAVKCPLWGQS